MNTAPGHRYNAVIVGGGVAGCYCAYRLSAAFPDWRIALFESAAELGGRLESRRLPGVQTPIELGGAFVSDLHASTFSLLHRLGLALTPVDWSRRFSFIRGRRLTDRTYRSKPEIVPYAFTAEERGRTPADILRAALEAIAPGFASLWPLDRAASPAHAARRLQQLRFKERLFDDWEIGALLREVVSADAYASFLAAFGSAANFRGASAYDAIRTLMAEMAPQQPSIVADGFQQLPLDLIRRSRAEVRTGARLRQIGGDGASVRLSFAGAAGEEIVVADRVILALPPDALAGLRVDAAPAHKRAFRAKLAKVAPVSACKLLLSFEQPWWRTRGTNGAISITASYTDLPMQQCYYFDRPGEGRALLLSAFADDASAAFWRALLADEACASDAMIEAAMAQLRVMHADADIPEPAGAMARAWPAAWHAWRPGARSWRSAAKMLGPHFDLPVFVCGEAYSEQQGWVEGALTTVDNLLREHFHVDALL